LIAFLKFVEENLDTYKEQATSGANPDFRVKDALLNAMEKISLIIARNPSLVGPVVELIREHVIPELRSETKQLKERACLCLGRYSRLDYGSEANVEIAHAMFEALSDESLPVQVASACSIYMFLRKSEVKAAIME
jgi:hypothetical protein